MNKILIQLANGKQVTVVDLNEDAEIGDEVVVKRKEKLNMTGVIVRLYVDTKTTKGVVLTCNLNKDL